MKTAAYLVLALAPACAPPTPSASVRFPPSPGDEAPAYGETLFPSDAYLTDGRVEVAAGLEYATSLGGELVSAHLRGLDGFGLRPLVEVFVNGNLDAASVPAETRDVDDGIAVVPVACGPGVRMQWRIDPVRGRVVGAPYPGVVLAEGAAYAVVVTDRLRDEEGVPLVPAEGLSALVSLPLVDVPARWRSTREAFDAVMTRVVWPGRIVALTAFTTQRASAPLLAARTLLDDPLVAPPPMLSFPDPGVVFRGAERLDALLGAPALDELGRERWGWATETGLARAGVGVIGTGVMTAPRFLLPASGTNLPGDDTFDTDPVTGVPRVVDPAAPLPVTFVLPEAPPPEGGYPVAIFGHGLGASRHQVLAFAAPLAAQGWAVAAIDMEGHGSRFVDVDEGNNNADLLSRFTGDPGLKDGFGDVSGLGTTFALLHDFKNLSAIRDQLRQSVLDLSSLAKLLASPDLDLSPLVDEGAPAPHFDDERITYLGESFGGVVGTALAAVEPNVGLYVLDVPGGGILDLALLGSPTMRAMTEMWIASAYGLDERIDRFHPLVGMAQAVLDGADPLTFAPHVLQDRFEVSGRRLGPRHLVVIEVIGDEVLPNRATHALARAAGLPLLAPFADDVDGLGHLAGRQAGNASGQTAALVQWSPATHGANWTSEYGERRCAPFGEGDDEEYTWLEEPERVVNPVRETLGQVLGLLGSYGPGEAPSLEPVQIAVP